MSDPIIFDVTPIAAELQQDESYHWCSCGRSSNQPFCDGSHTGTDLGPKEFSPDADGEVYLCQCKQTRKPPYCDGSHKNLKAAEKGQEKAPAAAGNPLKAELISEEPTVAYIHDLAEHGLSKVGHHGPMASMGVPRAELPHWDDIQLLVAQFARKPLMESDPVTTELVIGPNAARPLRLEIPLFVSDMSFGALSEEAKIALAKGAELAGTGICSGEGGMLPEEQQANSRYFYELASARFGYREELLENVQAFHFKGGQGAKTGTGGHLPARNLYRLFRTDAGYGARLWA